MTGGGGRGGERERDREWERENLKQPKLRVMGHLGTSVSRASDSWFHLRSWSRDRGIEPPGRALHWAWWILSLFPSQLLSPTSMLSLSLSNKKKSRVGHSTDWATQAPQRGTFYNDKSVNPLGRYNGYKHNKHLTTETQNMWSNNWQN